MFKKIKKFFTRRWVYTPLQDFEDGNTRVQIIENDDQWELKIYKKSNTNIFNNFYNFITNFISKKEGDINLLKGWQPKISYFQSFDDCVVAAVGIVQGKKINIGRPV